MQIMTAGPRIRAVLGPTNTGKTRLALDRMLGHSSGMIGFPLRLLARENYDRAAEIKGSGQVALITGEEKIVPARARYFLCTVESMPIEKRVSFLAIDEVQMCADPERGHVFTDRLLGARGTDETMFMGADTIAPLLKRLVAGVEFATRPRFSTLRYAGQRKITRLAPRSAVVAFSAANVYAYAELVRRQRGGAAVVMGALSPRTRNAQVGMYQAGEVDYLVATDAIGMGLNMDIDHVAFAETRKFDGRAPRALTAAELAQIAGRAGRHMNDGSFGTTAQVGPLDAEAVERIENHCFEPLDALHWRNARLRFTSLAALQASLAVKPAKPDLVKAREADDELALAALAGDPDVARLATHPEAVRLLWEVCRIPDFRKVMSGAHTRLLRRIYGFLMGPERRLSADWVARQVARSDRVDGDIETLVQRIANIRTWTYVSFQGDWLADAGHWQESTRAVEDRLSDALHDRLNQRFVDRRTAVLVGRMKRGEGLTAAVKPDGEVLVEGYSVGRIEGFRFLPDGAEDDAAAAKAVRGAAQRALRGEIADRIRRLETDTDDALALDGAGRIAWRGEPVARLVAGADALRPRVESTADDLDAAWRERLHRRAADWLDGHIAERLAPLLALRSAPLTGAARGLAFQLGEALGSMPRRPVERQLAGLDRAARRALGALGVRLGRESVYLPALVKPAAVDLRALLWKVRENHDGPPAPPAGRISLPIAEGVPAAFYEAVGYRPSGSVAVRVDMVERLAARAWTLSRNGPFAAGPELLSMLGCGADALTEVLARLGYRSGGDGDEATFERAPRRPRKAAPGKARGARAPDSPFAKLRELSLPR